MDDCTDSIDGGPCVGEIFDRQSLSGSGMTFPRCDKHYSEYVERVQPRLDAINRRYPVRAPDDFDPLFAGESWDED
jgi:hypothetical protein